MKLTRKKLRNLIESVLWEESKTSDREAAAAAGVAEFLQDFNTNANKEATDNEISDFIQGIFDVEEKSKAQKMSDELIKAISGGEAQLSKGSVEGLAKQMKVIGISGATLDRLAKLKLSNAGNVRAGTKLSDAGKLSGGGKEDELGSSDLGNKALNRGKGEERFASLGKKKSKFPEKGEALAASKIQAFRVTAQKEYTYAEVDGKWHFVKSKAYKGEDSNWKPLSSDSTENLKIMFKKHGQEEIDEQGKLISESFFYRDNRNILRRKRIFMRRY